MGQLLGESNEKLRVWRSIILAALGEQAQVIIEVIPELESIIGPQPPVTQLSGSAARSRFNLIFIKFVGWFATLSEDGRNALIKIKDNAGGMSPEFQAKIFDHLFTTKAVDKGTGLGLSISRQIVEVNHGGKITCMSELGKGTQFTVALPLTP